jgi:CHAD domain-containing protein
MAKRSKLVAALEEALDEPAVRAIAASTVAAGGAIAAGVVRKRAAAKQRHRRRRYRLRAGESPSRGVGRIARGQLELTIELLQGEDGRGDPRGDGEAIHEARKALKRLRALLRVSRGSLGEERYGRENVALRDAGRELSGARDAQVLVATFDDLTGRFAEELPPGAWSRFREALAANVEAANAPSDDARGDEVRAGVVNALSGARMRVATWPLAQHGGPESLLGGLEQIYRRGRRATRVARDRPRTENLHELRKRAKDLWHATQLLRPVSPKRMKALSRRAHRVSDLLGDDHDLSVLLGHARAQPELFGPSELELLATLIERRRKVLRRAALARAARLYGRKPRKLVRRLT